MSDFDGKLKNPESREPLYWMEQKNKEIAYKIIKKNPVQLFKGKGIKELSELVETYKYTLLVYNEIMKAGKRLSETQEQDYAKTFGLYYKARHYLEILNALRNSKTSI